MTTAKKVGLAGIPLAVVLLALGLVAQTKAPPIPQKDFTGKTAYRVVDITDGDTVTLAMDEKGGGSKTKIRLLGVDAPELGQAGGSEAQRFIENLLKGESVYIESDKPDEKDMYGRTLAYLYRAPDGLFVNLEIVRQGYGSVYTKAKCKQQDLLIAYETLAKDAKKGIWSADAGKSATDAPPAQPQQPKEQPRAGGEEKKPQQPDADITVYVTKTGGKYHRASCSYLKKSAIPMKLSDAKRSYSPCSRCNPP